ncbi:DUF3114 domain-containing protein [uncultured Limosilactobacillus sp.]|uniref:DUF3114 domain-containing protein n=1 Tax=uncultured Limosilactobacillus sp. TaxID=2837629 RepID=UPI0025F484DE|nr:DUF3114 domain-containing protein [uncultured Limosilactobacillus sp.]
MNLLQFLHRWWDQVKIRHFLRRHPEASSAYRQLRTNGWPAGAIGYFLRHQDRLEMTYQVGSPLYVAMLQNSGLTAYQQLTLIIDRHLQSWVDATGFLQLGSHDFRLAAGLSPQSFFYPYFRQLVVDAYPTPLGLSQDQLGRRVHLFRVYLDRQNISYLRRYPAPAGASDYQRLLKYCTDRHLALDYQTGANYHNRYHDHFDYPHNMKVQLMCDSPRSRYNDARMIEFIIDIASGKFVSQWNVYQTNSAGQVDANPRHYSVDELYQVANTESFNYGLPHGGYRLPAAYQGTHRYLDIQQPTNSQIRRQAKKYWRYPYDYNHGGPFAEIVRNGGDNDVRCWRAIPEDQRQSVYNDFVATLRAGQQPNQGIATYLDQRK